MSSRRHRRSSSLNSSPPANNSSTEAMEDLSKKSTSWLHNSSMGFLFTLRRQKPLRLVLASVAMVVAVVVAVRGINLQRSSATGSSNSATTASISSPRKPKPPPANWTKYEGCTVRTPSPTEEKTKPVWVPEYPASIGDAVIKAMISKLTGDGAKSYYASSKNGRKCKGKTVTAACMIVHPMVKSNPDGMADQYYHGVIYRVRNPATAIPAFLNSKRIKYAHLPGQYPIDDYRLIRDNGLQESFRKWKAQLVEWKSLRNYNVSLFLSLEDLMDIDKGPKAVERVAQVMKSAGYPTAPVEDMACLWYQSVGGNKTLYHYYEYGYDYTDYLPGYTEEQQAFLLKELEVMMQDYNDDSELVRILSGYHSYIRDDIVPDEPWVNKTAAA